MVAELAATLTATDDERLEQAEGLVRSFCGWHIAASRTETITVRGRGRPTLLLPSLYVTAVTAVTDDGTLLVHDEDYTWSEAGVITHAASFGTEFVEVTFTHGYDVPPPEVTGIVQAIAQRAVDNPGSRPRVQDGPFSDTFSQSGFNQAPALGLLDSEKETLRRYRIPGVA